MEIKFKVGQRVYHLDREILVSGVKEIRIASINPKYALFGFEKLFDESDLFATPDELLAHVQKQVNKINEELKEIEQRRLKEAASKVE